ncbi:hypothetical protein AALM99_02940 [Lactococcus muris]|uniref:Uncharacterized protein n=1 Tax=Lactococcus muris TaxID=2941330 RepID=A0ABV4D6M4_9LACT
MKVSSIIPWGIMFDVIVNNDDKLRVYDTLVKDYLLEIWKLLMVEIDLP